jgi:DNA topoisomerase-1
MSKTLVIVESPSKAKTIGKYLGGEYSVIASVGHVRDLPKSNKKAIDIESGFIPHYEITPRKELVIQEIQKRANTAEKIMLATDPDREGEAIAWHLKELLTDAELGGKKENNKKIKRATYNEITKEAVLNAIDNPRDIDEKLRQAQEARRVLDRIVGYELSGIVWKKVRYGLSAGRVQSPALRIIMEREREIRAFKPEDYWVITGKWHTEKAQELELTCVEEPKSKEKVDEIIELAKTHSWKVKDIEESKQKRTPRAPFITSTLQQAASSILGYSPSRTMGIAQKLYEAGYITYMRTDSTNIGDGALASIANLIKKEYGEKYLQVRKYTTKSKNAQEAHEAVRPTNINTQNAGTTDDQKKLYRLIWSRTVASQMSDAEILRTKIIANLENQKISIPDFIQNGAVVIFDGWLKVSPESIGDDRILPKCDKNENLELLNIESIAKQTQPPNRYTEAGLIKELEKRDIGRPSTYATICSTIIDRGYVEKEGKTLKPTDTGDVVSSFLEDNFSTYISDTFTAEMENELDEIANGNREYINTLSKFYKPFMKEIKEKAKMDKVTNLGNAEAHHKCPKCGGEMHVKLGRGGKFLSCAKYPDCDGALTIEGYEIKKDEPIGNDPVTGLPIFVLNGRFGPYVQLGIKMSKEKKRRTSKKKTEGTNVETDANVGAEQQTHTNIKPKMASIPKTIDPSKVTVEMALKYLSLPRTLGMDPKTGKEVVASAGRFGPYVVSDGNFRSIKVPDNVYEITLERALELLAQPKAARGKRKKE